MNKQMEREHLAKADLHIADAERRIVEQEIRVTTLAADGRNVTEAEKLLRLLRETLVQFRKHRELILEAIADERTNLRSLIQVTEVHHPTCGILGRPSRPGLFPP
jgi:hypothetical protein